MTTLSSIPGFTLQGGTLPFGPSMGTPLGRDDSSYLDICAIRDPPLAWSPPVAPRLRFWVWSSRRFRRYLRRHLRGRPARPVPRGVCRTPSGPASRARLVHRLDAAYTDLRVLERRVLNLLVEVAALIVSDQMRADVLVACSFCGLCLMLEAPKECLGDVLFEVHARTLCNHSRPEIFGERLVADPEHIQAAIPGVVCRAIASQAVWIRAVDTPRCSRN